MGPGVSQRPVPPAHALAGTIDSAELTATPINSNVSGLQASDTVTFADVVQNTGSDTYGAFNVTIKDTLPAGFINPTNIEVTNGAGTPLPYTLVGGGLFDPTGGIVLTDPNGSASLGILRSCGLQRHQRPEPRHYHL